MQINSMNSAAGASSAHQPPSAAALANRIFKQADTDTDGYITQEELEVSLKNAPQPRDGKKAPDAATLFKQADEDNDGKITKNELISALSKNKENESAGGPPRGAGGPPPPSGGPSPTGTGKTSGSASSSTDANKVYEDADSNEDGTVTTLEQANYDRAHPADVTKKEVQEKLSELASDERTGVFLDTEA